MILGALCVVAGVYKLVRYFRIGFAGVFCRYTLGNGFVIYYKGQLSRCYRNIACCFVHLIGGDDLLKNYKVEIDPGTLTVLASFNPADDYWFGTAPWDKERNLRERKAEFHYVAGGMSL